MSKSFSSYFNNCKFCPWSDLWNLQGVLLLFNINYEEPLLNFYLFLIEKYTCSSLALEDVPKEPCYRDNPLCGAVPGTWSLHTDPMGPGTSKTVGNFTDDKNSCHTLFQTKIWAHVMGFLFFFVYLCFLNAKGEDLIGKKW